MLNDIDGFSVTSEPVAVWNTDTPTNSYISSDITRTVGADSDVYVLTVTEDSTHGWKLNFSIKSGASPNIADQIDWTEVCVSPNAPSPSKSNAVIVLDTETMTSEDGAYVNHPGCAGCLVPEQYATCTPNVCSDYPRAQTIVATAGSELAGTGVVQVKNSSGSWRYITNANAIAMVTAALQARPIRVSCVESETHSYSGNAFPSGSESVSVQAGTNTDGSGTQETLNFTVSYIVASVVRLTCDYLTGFVPTGLAKLEISYSGIVFAPTLAPGELPIDHLDEYITFQRINSLAPLWESPWIAEQTGVSLDLADWPVEISGKSSPSDWYIYSGTSDNEIASPPNSSYITITTLPTFTFTPV